MLIISSECEVGVKVEAVRIEQRGDTQKEDEREDKIRVFVIASDEKLIGY